MNDFDSIKLKIASPQEILSWSFGEVTKPETINYRTQKPEKDGLFDERIFGPTKDWECYCGKYRRIRFKGVVCDKCGVEVTRAIVRRERMGHIALAIPIAHIWFLRSVPSKIGLILDISLNALERVIYYGAYVIMRIDEEARAEALLEIEREYKAKLKTFKKIPILSPTASELQNRGSSISKPNRKDLEEIGTKGRAEAEALQEVRDRARTQLNSLQKHQVITEGEFHDLSLKFGDIFEAGMGGETIIKLLEELDLQKLVKEFEAEAVTAPMSTKRKVLRQLKLARGFLKSGMRPEWMFLTALPVLPPDLRPMVPLDGGRYATSDLNDLYRRVINRNNRLKKLLELNAPEVITRNEKRMLQEAVDALIDNSARKSQGTQTAAMAPQKRPLRSLADMLKGKQGRFRQNLLGKRVDYSGRSVIVVGPNLKLHECGLPKIMALELFKPFIINKLIGRELAHNIKGANRLIEEGAEEVWAILEEVIENRHVLLNRAPTLHRLGIQAFKPVLVEGLAIQVHPMVCAAFNADFDGDQMAVHVPLSRGAQREAYEIMLSSRNLLKPATGIPIAVPTQDSILGVYYLTRIREGLAGEGKYFASENEAVLAYQFGVIHLQAKIKVRIKNDLHGYNPQESVPNPRKSALIETSVGRIIFNRALPEDFEFVNRELNSKGLKMLVGHIFEFYGIDRTAEILDQVKKIGFEYSTKSGISWGMDDLVVPKEKPAILEEAEKQITVLQEQYDRGLLTNEEKRKQAIETWKGAIDQVAKLVPKALDPDGSVYSIIASGARGSWSQPTQMAGLKGLVMNPAGEIIDLPVLSSFKEGFNVLEYFISTHGARKGSADTALRTASAGYLTRRLIDVSQDVIVHEKDCGEKRGFTMRRKDGEEFGAHLGERVFGRVVLDDVKDPRDGKIIVKSDEIVDRNVSRLIDEAKVEEVNLRSPMTCRNRHGVCQKCYGYDLGSNKEVSIGSAVGIVAAQAIGEPGTQLTMRTFHTGGVASAGDITAGLPRVEEVFEARSPKGKAALCEVRGKIIEIADKGKLKIIRIAVESEVISDKQQVTSDKQQVIPAAEQNLLQGTASGKGRIKDHKTAEIREYAVPQGTTIWVAKGDLVNVGQQLSEGHLDLKELFKTSGFDDTARYILNEIQQIYATQGADVNTKHIEVIVRQMFSRVRIKDSGSTSFTTGDIVEKSYFQEENDTARLQKGKPAQSSQLIMGISKVALSTESFLSSASFQETAKVLINTAVEAKSDRLRGLKENVILGRLIPAGTGYKHES